MKDKLGVLNDGTGMEIIMKVEATLRQMELAQKAYPNAKVSKEIEVPTLEYVDTLNEYKKEKRNESIMTYQFCAA